MAHWFYPAALSVGRGAGATVIAFNIINIISRIIWAVTAGIRKRGWGGWLLPPSWLLDSLLSLPAHANTHTPHPQPNNLLSSDNSNFPCHTWRAKSPNLLYSFWLASFFRAPKQIIVAGSSFFLVGLNCIIPESSTAPQSGASLDVSVRLTISALSRIRPAIKPPDRVWDNKRCSGTRSHLYLRFISFSADTD